ncbi:hypothetical protein GWK47_005596 [Chionoecetes opilio]|uniref:Uncharacterized protein n=1 Tax=Chionoecetes opilio TaxID=41210 RepID=A0A8J4YFL6_CHIOP|nr:hypothetical protein GWK47_005596 [Chionoecetes opilio]
MVLSNMATDSTSKCSLLLQIQEVIYQNLWRGLMCGFNPEPWAPRGRFAQPAHSHHFRSHSTDLTTRGLPRYVCPHYHPPKDPHFSTLTASSGSVWSIWPQLGYHNYYPTILKKQWNKVKTSRVTPFNLLTQSCFTKTHQEASCPPPVQVPTPMQPRDSRYPPTYLPPHVSPLVSRRKVENRSAATIAASGSSHGHSQPSHVSTAVPSPASSAGLPPAPPSLTTPHYSIHFTLVSFHFTPQFSLCDQTLRMLLITISTTHALHLADSKPRTHIHSPLSVLLVGACRRAMPLPELCAFGYILLVGILSTLPLLSNEQSIDGKR